jgi:diacylglycerol O-acyltransferase / wax synthase
MTVESRERMTRFDTTMLRMDRPTNHMVISGVVTLAGPVNIEQLMQKLAEPFLAIRRFRQRVERHDGRYWWCDDPNFDPLRHIEHARLAPPGSKEELTSLVSELASRPLDHARPLWNIHIVEDYDDGIAVIVRLHHAIADDTALRGVLLSLTDEIGDLARSAVKGPQRPCTVPAPGSHGATGTRTRLKPDSPGRGHRRGGGTEHVPADG